MPLDYQKPEAGSFSLYYEVNSDFDPSKPVILYFFDAQQPVHYSADGLKKTVNLDYNFIRFHCRGFGESLIPQLLVDEHVQWLLAWKTLDSENMVRDAEAVRQDYLEHFKPQNRRVFVMGESGGGLLAMQYLAEYPDKAKKAFLGYCNYNNIQRELNGLNLRQWLANLDPKLPEMVRDSLNFPEKYGVEKDKLALIIQRLGYDRYWDKCYETRVQMFVQSILSGSKELYLKLIDQWKLLFVLFDLRPENEELIECGKQLFPDLSSDSRKVFEAIISENLGGTVRMAEFFFNDEKPNLSYDIELEAAKIFSPALFALWKDGKLPIRTIDCIRKLSGKNLETSIFVLGGYYDHAIPHQSIEKIGESLKNAQVALLNDNHSLTVHGPFYHSLAKWFLKKSRQPTKKELQDFFSKLKPGDLIFSKF